VEIKKYSPGIKGGGSIKHGSEGGELIRNSKKGLVEKGRRETQQEVHRQTRKGKKTRRKVDHLSQQGKEKSWMKMVSNGLLGKSLEGGGEARRVKKKKRGSTSTKQISRHAKKWDQVSAGRRKALRVK